MLLRWFYWVLRHCSSYLPHPSLFYKYSRRVGPGPIIGSVHGQELSWHSGSSSMSEKIPLNVLQCNSSELVLLLVVGGEPLAKQRLNHLEMNIKLVWKWNQNNWVNTDSPPCGRQSCWMAAAIPWPPAHLHRVGVSSILTQPGCRVTPGLKGCSGHPCLGSPGPKLQGGAETGCSKPCTPQGLCSLLPHWEWILPSFPWLWQNWLLQNSCSSPNRHSGARQDPTCSMVCGMAVAVTLPGFLGCPLGFWQWFWWFSMGDTRYQLGFLQGHTTKQRWTCQKTQTIL